MHIAALHPEDVPGYHEGIVDASGETFTEPPWNADAADVEGFAIAHVATENTANSLRPSSTW